MVRIPRTWLRSVVRIHVLWFASVAEVPESRGSNPQGRGLYPPGCGSDPAWPWFGSPEGVARIHPLYGPRGVTVARVPPASADPLDRRGSDPCARAGVGRLGWARTAFAAGERGVARIQRRSVSSSAPASARNPLLGEAQKGTIGQPRMLASAPVSKVSETLLGIELRIQASKLGQRGVRDRWADGEG